MYYGQLENKELEWFVNNVDDLWKIDTCNVEEPK